MKKLKSIFVLTAIMSIVACNNKGEVILTSNTLNMENVRLGKFPSKKYLKTVDSCVLRFSCEMYKNGEYQRAWHGHCFLYAAHEDKSYLAMPKHCFSFDSTQEYKLFVTDVGGRKIELKWNGFKVAENCDAELLIVEKIRGLPNLCERELITSSQLIGDSVLLWVPFNSRNVRRKFGKLSKGNKVEVCTMLGEPGDSGGLIIGRDGVIGMNFGSNENGKTLVFVRIQVFEFLYYASVHK